MLLCYCVGDVWHVTVKGLPGSGVCYAVRVSGNGGWDTGYRWDKSRLLLDPRAPLVAGRKAWGKRDDFEEFQQEVGDEIDWASWTVTDTSVICWVWLFLCRQRVVGSSVDRDLPSSMLKKAGGTC